MDIETRDNLKRLLDLKVPESIFLNRDILLLAESRNLKYTPRLVQILRYLQVWANLSPMNARVRYLRYFTFVGWQLAQTSVLLYFLRAFAKLDTPLFEQIIFTVCVSAGLSMLFFFLKIKLLSERFIRDEFLSLVIISGLLGCLILPLSLVNVDRSRSFYVLSWVENGSISSINGELKFRIKSSEALDINGVALRLEEQIGRGLVQEANGRYQLTPIGDLYISMANFLADLYRLENWDANKN